VMSIKPMARRQDVSQNFNGMAGIA